MLQILFVVVRQLRISNKIYEDISQFDLGLIFQISHTHHKVDGVIKLLWPLNREITRFSPALLLLVLFLSPSYFFHSPPCPPLCLTISLLPPHSSSLTQIPPRFSATLFSFHHGISPKGDSLLRHSQEGMTGQQNLLGSHRSRLPGPFSPGVLVCPLPLWM